jgi:hypothetical protein
MPRGGAAQIAIRDLVEGDFVFGAVIKDGNL